MLPRYRTGIDAATGGLLVGWPHVAQSLAKVWLTRPDTRPMLLAFGSDVRGLLAEDVTPDLALDLYDRLATAAHAHEPEYRLSTLQLVSLTREGGLGVRHAGTYYPEGRFGNFAIAEAVGTVFRAGSRTAAAAIGADIAGERIAA